MQLLLYRVVYELHRNIDKSPSTHTTPMRACSHGYWLDGLPYTTPMRACSHGYWLDGLPYTTPTRACSHGYWLDGLLYCRQLLHSAAYGTVRTSSRARVCRCEQDMSTCRFIMMQVCMTWLTHVHHPEASRSRVHATLILANHPGISRTVLETDLTTCCPGSVQNCPRNYSHGKCIY